MVVIWFSGVTLATSFEEINTLASYHRWTQSVENAVTAFGKEWHSFLSLLLHHCNHQLVKLTIIIREAVMREKCSFFNIVQKAFDPPPLLFEHLSYFAGGVFC